MSFGRITRLPVLPFSSRDSRSAAGRCVFQPVAPNHGLACLQRQACLSAHLPGALGGPEEQQQLLRRLAVYQNSLLGGPYSGSRCGTLSYVLLSSIRKGCASSSDLPDVASAERLRKVDARHSASPWHLAALEGDPDRRSHAPQPRDPLASLGRVPAERLRSCRLNGQEASPRIDPLALARRRYGL